MKTYIRRYAPCIVGVLGVLLMLSGVSMAESCTDAELPGYIARAVAGLALCGAAVAGKEAVHGNQ